MKRKIDMGKPYIAKQRDSGLFFYQDGLKFDGNGVEIGPDDRKVPAAAKQADAPKEQPKQPVTPPAEQPKESAKDEPLGNQNADNKPNRKNKLGSRKSNHPFR